MAESEAIQKAIRHFECIKNDAVVVLNSGFGTRPGESSIVYRNRKMYSELAIQALEKQIPKKPDFTEDKEFALCPCCNGKGLFDKQKYCDNCGQKLDWSEEE